jgi:hypothetical protein
MEITKKGDDSEGKQYPIVTGILLQKHDDIRYNAKAYSGHDCRRQIIGD